MELSDIRKLTAGTQTLIYFNTSGFSPKPTPVIEEVIKWMHFQNQGPARSDVYQPILAMFDGVREKIGKALNASADDIMLNENATVGINIVAYGIDWKPGDNVILSTHEHPGNRITWYNIATRYGVELRFLPITNDEQALLASLDDLIDARTRLVSVSHVSRRSGLRLPARAISDLAHAKDVPVLFDGAQSFGSIPVDVQAIDCDFYTFSGHKFIMGPQGTGGFYARRDRLEWLKPSWIGSHSQSEMDDRGNMKLHNAAKRFEFGTRNMADHAGFGKALDIWEEIGWDRVFGKIAESTTLLKQRLLELPGIELATPLPYEKSSGIVSFRIDGLDLGKLAGDLLEHEKILASPIEWGENERLGLRISVHVFNTPEEFDTLISGLKRISAQAAKE
jgi:selenocysteine lyase/cysteine desulfurase